MIKERSRRLNEGRSSNLPRMINNFGKKERRNFGVLRVLTVIAQLLINCQTLKLLKDK